MICIKGRPEFASFHPSLPPFLLTRGLHASASRYDNLSVSTPKNLSPKLQNMYVILSLDPTTRLPGFLKADYGDSQDFRLVCRRVNSAVEPIARSKLTLDWDHSKGEFPLEQLQAYATPDKTGAPGRYVRHLTLRQMCVDYDAPTPLSFDYLLGPYNEANDGTETQHEVLKKARTGFVLQLLGKAISGFGKLETVT